MNYLTFIERLEQCGNLSEESKSLLRGRAPDLVIEERTHLLEPGSVCKHIYFIKEGLFRSYTLNDEKDETTNFMGPDDFMTSISSFFNRSFSSEGLVCENKAIVIRVSYHDWMAMCQEDPNFMEISLNIIVGYLVSHYEQSHIYRTGNTSDKLEQLCRIYPGILNKVAQKHIASYFGVTEQTMSSIITNMK